LKGLKSQPVRGDEEEEYPFVNKYLSFQKEPIVLVEEESCPVYDIDNEEEESMEVYDTDIEDVIEDEEGFVGKGGFGREEYNIEDVGTPFIAEILPCFVRGLLLRMRVSW
nr:hypothetical protein [Tanacetum cinerariifolium]GEX95598.1 hypothetical protein [Tanacetum cinerariifolium]